MISFDIETLPSQRAKRQADRIKATIFIVDQGGFTTIDLSEEITFLKCCVFNHQVKDILRLQHTNVTKRFMGWQRSNPNKKLCNRLGNI